MRKAAEKQFSMSQNDILMNDVDSDVQEELEHAGSFQIADAEHTDQAYDLDAIQLNDEVEFKIDVKSFEQDSVLPEDALIEDSPEDNLFVDAIEDTTSNHEGQAILDVAPEPEVVIPEIDEVQANILPIEINHDVDLTALFHLPSPVDGERLRQFLTGLVNLDKPILAYGLNGQDAWKQLTREEAATTFTKASFSLQLADRAGAVSSETLQRFKQMVSEIAYSLSAQVEWLGAQEPLASAQALDAFCLEVDKTVGFHLVNGTSGRFTGTKFKGLAEANGLVLKDDGAFYALSEHGHALFRVINVENNPFNIEMIRTVSLKGLTFQMDIALAEHCTETFNRMVIMAKNMALSLSANLVDDHQRELSDVHIEKIRQQLKLIQVQMTVKGIVPGSAVALRLFS